MTYPLAIVLSVLIVSLAWMIVSLSRVPKKTELQEDTKQELQKLKDQVSGLMMGNLRR